MKQQEDSVMNIQGTDSARPHYKNCILSEEDASPYRISLNNCY